MWQWKRGSECESWYTQSCFQLSSQLCRAQEQIKTLQAENSFTQTKFEGLQQKHKHSQDEVLALRGWPTTSQKSQEKLQVKYSLLEKSASSPTVLKVSTRSKEEQKLAAECRRKVNTQTERQREDGRVLQTSCLTLLNEVRSRKKVLCYQLNWLRSHQLVKSCCGWCCASQLCTRGGSEME